MSSRPQSAPVLGGGRELLIGPKHSRPEGAGDGELKRSNEMRANTLNASKREFKPLNQWSYKRVSDRFEVHFKDDGNRIVVTVQAVKQETNRYYIYAYNPNGKGTEERYRFYINRMTGAVESAWRVTRKYTKLAPTEFKVVERGDSDRMFPNLNSEGEDQNEFLNWCGEMSKVDFGTWT